ncbi:MAG: hypothetical protein V3S07_00835 [Micropepsaceae bacterium]
MAGAESLRKDAAKRKAQKLFSESERRNEQARNEREKARDAIATKTAKLRALRLARDAEEKANADAAAQSKASK